MAQPAGAALNRVFGARSGLLALAQGASGSLLRAPVAPAAVVARSYSAEPDRLSALKASDREAEALYRRHDQAFTNLPLENIYFHPNKESSHPQLRYKIVQEGTGSGWSYHLGVMHLTPFGLAAMCAFSPKGTYGRLRRDKTQVKDYSQAMLEVALSHEPLTHQTESNDLMLEYFEWLRAIERKLLEHLVEYRKDYTCMDRYKDMGADEAMQTAEEIHISPLRQHRSTATQKGDFLLLRTKLFSKHNHPLLVEGRTADMDEAMAGRGYQRNYIPVFDERQKELPMDKYFILQNDVVCAQIRLGSTVYTNRHAPFPATSLWMEQRCLIRHRKASNNPDASTVVSPFAS